MYMYIYIYIYTYIHNICNKDYAPSIKEPSIGTCVGGCFIGGGFKILDFVQN